MDTVAAVVLPGGGHIGVAAYAKKYYYSLMMNFFDASLAPRAVSFLRYPSLIAFLYA